MVLLMQKWDSLSRDHTKVQKKKKGTRQPSFQKPQLIKDSSHVRNYVVGTLEFEI